MFAVFKITMTETNGFCSDWSFEMHGSVFKPGFLVWNAKQQSLQHVFVINISTTVHTCGRSWLFFFAVSINSLVRDLPEQVGFQCTQFERNSVPELNSSIIKKGSMLSFSGKLNSILWQKKKNHCLACVLFMNIRSFWKKWSREHLGLLLGNVYSRSTPRKLKMIALTSFSPYCPFYYYLLKNVYLLFLHFKKT